MKIIFFVLGLISLSSCITCYKEIYHVEKHPVEWQDTIITKQDHWHFCDTKDNWYCVEIEPDTVILTLDDTIQETTLLAVYKEREYSLRWIIKNKSN